MCAQDENIMNRDDIIKISQQVKSLSVGGPIVDTSATLCLYADNIDPDTISLRLGTRPTSALKRGDVVGRRKPAPIGQWSLEAPENLTFEEKLQYLLRVTTNERSTWDSLALVHRIELRCAFFLHSWTESVDLPADIVAEIGNRHWAICLSVYSAEGEEIVETFLSEHTD
jgi:hypothetical protein